MDLPLLMTMAVSMEVEKIGHTGGSSDISRLMKFLKHYTKYPNNMAKVLVAVKTMCMRVEPWVVRLFLQYKFPGIVAEGLRLHKGVGNLVSRACEAISAIAHVTKGAGVKQFMEEGVATALIG